MLIYTGSGVASRSRSERPHGTIVFLASAAFNTTELELDNDAAVAVANRSHVLVRTVPPTVTKVLVIEFAF